MNNAAAIQAQLVDIRNIGTEKCVKLTLHVPAEQAPLVLKAFGWPTASEPVPVALARLTQPKENEAQPRPSTIPTDQATTGGAQSKKSWHEMSPAQQAGILCADQAFMRFLDETIAAEIGWGRIYNAERAAMFVRKYCGVESRSEIKPGTLAVESWMILLGEYRAWMLEPAVTG